MGMFACILVSHAQQTVGVSTPRLVCSATSTCMSKEGGYAARYGWTQWKYVKGKGGSVGAASLGETVHRVEQSRGVSPEYRAR